MRTTKIIVSAILAIIIIGSTAVCSFGAGVIGAESAKEIALNHAGLSAQDVIFTKAKLEYDDGIRQYEIEFYSGAYEYDYEINAYTGKIRSFDKEYDDDRYIPGATVPTTSAANYIGADRAKEIALAHSGVNAADAKFIKAAFDYDNGIAQYDVEFYVGTYEYDYDINAVTGEIISYDRDFEGVIPVAPSAPAAPAELIGVEKAKEIALAHAGVNASSAIFVKAALDYDDGIAQYDIEFYVGSYEYDYDINATTGQIISYDRDFEGVIPNVSTTTAAPTTPPAPAALIGVEKAKEIALAHAGLTASDVNFKKARLDYDDGVAQYDIEFKVGTTKEYDYEIDGLTGTITDFDYDLDRVSFFGFFSSLFKRIFGR